MAMMAPPAPILVVDDDAGIRTTLRMLLEGETYPVKEAPDGATSLAFLRGTPAPYVVLLDYLMPQMNGEAVLREVAHSRALQRHAFLLLTAYADRLSIETQAFVRQLDIPVMAKPFDVDQLLEAISAASRKLAKPAPSPE